MRKPYCRFYSHIDINKVLILFTHTIPLGLPLSFLIPAHKGWGYSRPLRHPGGGCKAYKACGCSRD